LALLSVSLAERKRETSNIRFNTSQVANIHLNGACSTDCIYQNTVIKAAGINEAFEVFERLLFLDSTFDKPKELTSL
jgi:hypothetical protein